MDQERYLVKAWSAPGHFKFKRLQGCIVAVHELDSWTGTGRPCINRVVVAKVEVLRGKR